MAKLKSDDDVIVIAGKDKGKRGTVRRLLDSDRVIVSGVNMVKKHTKPNPQAGVAGGIVEQEAPIRASNLALFNSKSGKGERVGYRVEDGKKVLEHAVSDMAKIAGQKPVITKSRKSIAGFKIRDGWPIGCKVTLRDERMYEFLDRLISISIPRVRDFRGVSPKQFDGRGNFAMGVTEQIIFPEIDYDQIDKLRGMDITISTTAENDEQGRALLAAFNFPFRS